MKQLLISLQVVFCFTILSHAQNKTGEAQVRSKHFNVNSSGLAIEGYDPVAYFSGKAQKGNATISFLYNGITYRFSTAANLILFKAAPEKYEPAYGGWCAYAMGSSGEKVEVDPETFKIVNGELYLFYNAYFNNTLKTWNKNEKNLNQKADANWKKLYK